MSQEKDERKRLKDFLRWWFEIHYEDCYLYQGQDIVGDFLEFLNKEGFKIKKRKNYEPLDSSFSSLLHG